MVADALELASLTVQEKSLIRDKLYGTYSESRIITVDRLALSINHCPGLVQKRRFGRPERRIFNNKILDYRQILSRIRLRP